MLGSLIGDCLGSPFEGEDRPIAKSVLNPYFEKLHEPPAGRKSNLKFILPFRFALTPLLLTVMYKPYTDDTAMTFSLARSLVEKKQFDAGDVAKKCVFLFRHFNGIINHSSFFRFVDEYFAQPRRGYGGNIIDVFKALKMDDCKDPYGPARLQFAGRGSYGNGSAMRMTPVALFCQQNMEEAINMAYKSSLITHTNELGYNGAILQCLAIHLALRLDPTQPLDTDNFAKQLEDKMGQIEKCDSSVSSQIGVISGTDTRTVTSLLQPSNEEYQRRHAMPNFIKSSYRNKLEEMRHLLKRKPAASADKVIDVLGHFVTAYGSVPTAIYSFLRSVKDLQEPDSGTAVLCEETPFQRTIRTAVSLGGDTDTIASMAGAIAGAYYGNHEIAQGLLDHCEGVEQAMELADSLYDSIEH